MVGTEHLLALRHAERNPSCPLADASLLDICMRSHIIHSDAISFSVFH